MRISEVRVKLVDNRSEKLQAFCTMTVEGEFVVRDIKIIDGARGPFIAMPSRKLSDRCGRCGIKNHLRAKYCNECGNRLAPNRAKADGRGRARLHTDIAHPINASCRQFMEVTILAAFHAEIEKAKSPDYVAPDLEDFEDGYDVYDEPVRAAPSREKGQEKEREAGHEA